MDRFLLDCFAGKGGFSIAGCTWNVQRIRPAAVGQYVRVAAFAVVALVVSTGCESKPKGAVVRGKLLMNGQPAQVDITGKQLPPGDTGRMKITFYPVQADNDVIIDNDGNVKVGGAETATVESDSTFHLGRGAPIRPGKYRVVITHIDPLSGKDLLKGRFSEGMSQITREVTGGDQEIVIDLAKPTG